MAASMAGMPHAGVDSAPANTYVNREAEDMAQETISTPLKTTTWTECWRSLFKQQDSWTNRVDEIIRRRKEAQSGLQRISLGVYNNLCV